MPPVLSYKVLFRGLSFVFKNFSVRPLTQPKFFFVTSLPNLVLPWFRPQFAATLAFFRLTRVCRYFPLRAEFYWQSLRSFEFARFLFAKLYANLTRYVGTLCVWFFFLRNFFRSTTLCFLSVFSTCHCCAPPLLNLPDYTSRSAPFLPSCTLNFAHFAFTHFVFFSLLVTCTTCSLHRQPLAVITFSPTTSGYRYFSCLFSCPLPFVVYFTDNLILQSRSSPTTLVCYHFYFSVSPTTSSYLAFELGRLGLRTATTTQDHTPTPWGNNLGVPLWLVLGKARVSAEIRQTLVHVSLLVSLDTHLHNSRA